MYNMSCGSSIPAIRAIACRRSVPSRNTNLQSQYTNLAHRYSQNTQLFPSNSARRRSQTTAAVTTPNTSDRFSYRLTAAYCGKRNRFNPDYHHFSFTPSTQSQRSRFSKEVPRTIPDAARLQSGQDACFASTVGKTSAVAFGVADGVGGWQDQGIDSAAFAHGITMYMEEVARHAEGPTPIDPQALLQKAYDRVCNDKSIVGGGSTACIAVADGGGVLRVANLGDSGFMQLREKKVHYFSAPQTHAFNTPYQLSRIPPKILAQIEIFGGGAPFSDMPGEANVTEHEMQHGDVLVFATDGVWDNLSLQDMLELVCDRMEDAGVWVDRAEGPAVGEHLSKFTQQEVDGDDRRRNLQTLLATDIVQVAKEHGLNPRRDGPFAKAFQKAYPMDPYRGGKPDDIAVIVAVVIDSRFTGEDTHGKSKL